MNNMVLKTCTLRPLEVDEDPGMPSFEVVGTHYDVPFTGVLSFELDGRDIEWNPGDENSNDVDPYELTQLVYETDAYQLAMARQQIWN
jgi:hypothetical protein